MSRKWAALASSLVVALFVAGLSWGDDKEDSPLLKIMKQVKTENAAVQKGIRNAANYKKSQAELPKTCEKMVKLLTDSKPLGKSAVEGPHNEKKKTIDDYNKLLEDTKKELTTFCGLVAKTDTTQAQAKDGFKAVTKSCTACHDLFRVEE